MSTSCNPEGLIICILMYKFNLKRGYSTPQNCYTPCEEWQVQYTNYNIGLQRKYCECVSDLPDSQLSSFSIMDIYISASHEKPVWEKEEEEFLLYHRGRNMISIGKYFSGMGESYHKSEVIWWGRCLPHVLSYWYIHKFCWCFDISLICMGLGPAPLKKQKQHVPFNLMG